MLFEENKWKLLEVWFWEIEKNVKKIYKKEIYGLLNDFDFGFIFSFDFDFEFELFSEIFIGKIYKCFLDLF